MTMISKFRFWRKGIYTKEQGASLGLPEFPPLFIFTRPLKCKVASLVLTELLPSLSCTPPLAITDPKAAFTGLL